MESTLPEVPLANIADGPTPDRSVFDTLRGEYQNAQARKTVTVRIPGYDHLWGTFRALREFSEVYDTFDPERNQHLEEKQIPVPVSLNLLAESSVTTSAVIDGVTHDLGLPLGLELYDKLIPPDGSARPLTDTEAISELFPLGSASMVTFAQSLQMWQAGKMREVDGELLGNF